MTNEKDGWLNVFLLSVWNGKTMHFFDWYKLFGDLLQFSVVRHSSPSYSFAYLCSSVSIVILSSDAQVFYCFFFTFSWVFVCLCLNHSLILPALHPLLLFDTNKTWHKLCNVHQNHYILLRILTPNEFIWGFCTITHKWSLISFGNALIWWVVCYSKILKVLFSVH